MLTLDDKIANRLYTLGVNHPDLAPLAATTLYRGYLDSLPDLSAGESYLTALNAVIKDAKPGFFLALLSPK